MAGHPLIDDYLATLARHLPADTVDELSDGLTETYRRHRHTSSDPEAAAAAAITEFGIPEQVIEAFVRQAPGRRTALALLASGPIVGGCWAATLIAGHAWTWPIPAAARFTFGIVLLTVVAMLALAATARTSLRRTRITAVAGLGLIALDGAMCGAIVLVEPNFVWPMAIATLASLARLSLTTRALPRILAG